MSALTVPPSPTEPQVVKGWCLVFLTDHEEFFIKKKLPCFSDCCFDLIVSLLAACFQIKFAFKEQQEVLEATLLLHFAPCLKIEKFVACAISCLFLFCFFLFFCFVDTNSLRHVCFSISTSTGCGWYTISSHEIRYAEGDCQELRSSTFGHFERSDVATSIDGLPHARGHSSKHRGLCYVM